MNPPSTTPAATPARRTRTGCKTCRQRKLKCDEGKPVCGQCRKSNRDCVPSEGIAFRHAQNAGLSEGSNQLSSFYKYRQRFNNTYFVPIPPELTFIQVTDPYDSTEHETVHHEQPHLAQQILHGISHYQQYELAQQQHPQYVDVATSSLKAMIDPSLEADTSPELPKLEGEQLPDDTHVSHGTDMAEADINETIMKALGTADEIPRAL